MEKNERVRPLGLLDFAAQLTEKAESYNYEKTKDIRNRYIELVTTIRGFNTIWQANIQEEVLDLKKEVNSVIADLMNDLENYYEWHPDELTAFNIQQLKALAVHFKVYENAA